LPDAAALAFLVHLGLLEARAASFFMLKIKRSSSVGVLLPGAARLPCFFRLATLSSVEDSEVEESEVEEDESPEEEEETLSLRDAAALAAGVLPAFLVLADLLEARSEEDESSAVSFFMLRIKRSSSAGVLLPGSARLALLFCMAGASSAEDAEVESSEEEEDESSEEEEDKSPEDEEDESPEEEELSSSEEDPSLAPFILATREARNPHSPPCRRYIAYKFHYNSVVNDLRRVFFKYPTLLSFTRGLLEDDLLGASLNIFGLNLIRLDIFRRPTFCKMVGDTLRIINYKDTKTKCRHLKKLTSKGTLRQVFIRVYRLEIQSVMLVTQLCELLPL
jgi:hypothetical protein